MTLPPLPLHSYSSGHWSQYYALSIPSPLLSLTNYISPAHTTGNMMLFHFCLSPSLLPALLCLLASFGHNQTKGLRSVEIGLVFAAIASPVARSSSEPPAWQPLIATGHDRMHTCLNGGSCCVLFYMSNRIGYAFGTCLSHHFDCIS